MSIVSFFKNTLKKSSSKIIDSVASSLFSKQKIDSDLIEKIEESLISTDMGYEVISKITQDISKKYFDKTITQQEIIEIIKNTTKTIFSTAKSFDLINSVNSSKSKPYTITFIGMNGSGKTTTIAKIANKLKKNGLKGQIICGDTFRAAATEQLVEWGKRLDIETIHKSQGDPSGLIFESVQIAYNVEQKPDYILIDTAGRLHTNTNLMGEVNKIERVLSKIDTTYPNESILVIDASIGQSVYKHIEEFQKYTKLTGLIITKIDNSAKGGIIIGIANKFNIPIYFLGLGENLEDLIEFNPEHFIEELFENEF